MNYQEALDQAVKMHSQKIPYAKIAEHLEKSGYISAKTKKAIGHMAVRQMVENAKAKDKKEMAADNASIQLRSPKSDALAAISEVTGLKSIDTEVKFDLIERIVERTKKAAG